MSVVTRLTELCAAFRLSESQLRVAIQVDETTGSHARLLRRNAVLLDRIEQFVPRSVEELEELIDFHARQRIDSLQVGATAPDWITGLLTRFDRASLPIGKPVAGRRKPLPDPFPASVEPEDLARLVMGAPGRVCAIGPGMRYLAVSGGLAEDYRTTPSRMLGRHMFEVIGCGHYQGRARQKVELAFQGRRQNYRFDALNPDGRPIEVRARIHAVEDNAGRRYAALMENEPAAQNS